jgi:hypothetical protein
MLFWGYAVNLKLISKSNLYHDKVLAECLTVNSKIFPQRARNAKKKFKKNLKLIETRIELMKTNKSTFNLSSSLHHHSRR